MEEILLFLILVVLIAQWVQPNPKRLWNRIKGKIKRG